MKTLLLIIYWFCSFYLAQDQISKTESGKKFIDSLRTGALRFFHWRADSDIRMDLKKLSRFFGIISIVGICLSLIIIKLGFKLNSFYVLLILISPLFWIALIWGTNTKKETLEWLKSILWIIIAPWLFYLIDSVISNKNLLILPRFGEMLMPLGITVTGSLQIATALFAFLIVGFIVITIFWLFMNTLIVGLIISLLWISVRCSKIIITTKSELITNVIWILFFITLMLTNII